jgi:MBG domain (YGX type)/YDG domain
MDATVGVGTYPIVPGAAGGSGLGNYTIKYVDGKLTVNPAALTVTATDRSKTYGTALSLGTTGFTTSGLVNADTVSGVTLASAGATATAGVGIYPIAPSAAIGSGLANYTISYVNGGLTVNPAVLAAGLTGTVGKDYDGNTAANRITPANYTLTGVVNGDAVALNDPTSGVYATANVGTGITITVTGLALSGRGAANYVLANNSAAGKIGTISPAELVVGLQGIVRKQFDGNTVAMLAPDNYTLSGVIGSDVVVLKAPSIGAYASPNPATGIPVTVAGLGIGGPAAGNYALVSTTATGNIGEIFALPISNISNISVISSISNNQETVAQPQPSAQAKPETFYLPFGGNFACIASAGAQKGTHMPLLSGFGVTDTAGGGALLLDQPYAAAEVKNGSLVPITISSCEALISFQGVLQGLGR